MEEFELFTYESGLGATHGGSGDGPSYALNQGLLSWLEKAQGITIGARLIPDPEATGTEKLARIATLCERLAQKIADCRLRQRIPLVIGGDHTSAIGTWSGVHQVSTPHGLGLIWIDAHMDCHTPKTSTSGAYHGMPLACLLGYGPSVLTHIMSAQAKILPAQLCLLGVRSFESGEAQLLKSLGVKIFTMADIQNLGFSHCLALALDYVGQTSHQIGLSVDLDALDPIDAPGVSCPVSQGISAQDFLQALPLVAKQPNLVGVEVVEYNPHVDVAQRTGKLLLDIIKRLTEVRYAS